MERDAKITAQNKDEKSALFLAAESNHPEIVEVSFGRVLSAIRLHSGTSK